MQAAEQVTTGFVLHSRPYRETSLIVEFFSQEHGRLSILFRGARKPTKKQLQLSRQLQPFQMLLVAYAGRSELKTGHRVESVGAGFYLPGTRLYSGLYLNELLVRLLYKEDAHPELFQLYRYTLESLRDAEAELEWVLRSFEFKLLAELGYGIHFHADGVSHQPIEADKNYGYDPEQGFYPLEDTANVNQSGFSGRSLQALAVLMARNDGHCEGFAVGQRLADLRQVFKTGEHCESADSVAGHLEQARKDAKRLARMALAPLLGNAPLESRKLFVNLKTQ